LLFVECLVSAGYSSYISWKHRSDGWHINASWLQAPSHDWTARPHYYPEVSSTTWNQHIQVPFASCEGQLCRLAWRYSLCLCKKL